MSGVGKFESEWEYGIFLGISGSEVVLAGTIERASFIERSLYYCLLVVLGQRQQSVSPCPLSVLPGNIHGYHGPQPAQNPATGTVEPWL